MLAVQQAESYLVLQILLAFKARERPSFELGEPENGRESVIFTHFQPFSSMFEHFSSICSHFSTIF